MYHNATNLSINDRAFENIKDKDYIPTRIGPLSLQRSFLTASMTSLVRGIPGGGFTLGHSTRGRQGHSGGKGRNLYNLCNDQLNQLEIG